MPWRSVKSQLKLLSEINGRWPNRDKSADGSIGDAGHAARHSDHNPEPDGTVDARDYTHDPAHGADMDIVYNTIVARRDPRVSYIIWEGHITSGNRGPSPWVRRPYSGSNGHYHHLHLSVLDVNQDDESPWGIAAQEEDDLPYTEAQLKTIVTTATKPLADQLASLTTELKNLQVVVWGKDDAETNSRIKTIAGRAMSLFSFGHWLHDHRNDA